MWNPSGRELTPHLNTQTGAQSWAYSAMQHVPSGLVIRCGCSVFLRSAPNEVPHLARVDRIWKDFRELNLRMTISWYHRLSENHVTLFPKTPKKDSVQYVNCIDDICYVLDTDAAYEKYQSQHALYCLNPKGPPSLPTYLPFGTLPNQVFVLDKDFD